MGGTDYQDQEGLMDSLRLYWAVFMQIRDSTKLS